MRIYLFLSRKFTKKVESTLLQTMEEILHGLHVTQTGRQKPTKLIIDDTPTRHNHLAALHALNFARLDLEVVSIDQNSRMRVTMPSDTPTPEYTLTQYPRPNPVPRQPDAAGWRSIFLARDKWIVQQALAPAEWTPAMLYFLTNKKDRELMPIVHFANDFVTHIGREAKPASAWGIVHHIDIRQVYEDGQLKQLEDSQPKQLTLF